MTVSTLNLSMKPGAWWSAMNKSAMKQRLPSGYLSTAAALLALVLVGCGENDGSADSSGGGVGRGGSTARMTIAGDYLYAISGASIQLFDITTPASPNPYVKVWVDWNIETLFPYENYLLIGASNGLHIMDNTDPARPEYVSRFTHAQAQDPVVAENGYAYVTLRDGRQASEFTNQLEVIDIHDITNPSLVDVIPMQRPYGLSIENNRLFVCDDVAGIKEFNTSDPTALTLEETISGVNCNDVILQQQRLYAITDNRLLQYDVSVSPPVQLSNISEGGN